MMSIDSITTIFSTVSIALNLNVAVTKYLQKTVEKTSGRTIDLRSVAEMFIFLTQRYVSFIKNGTLDTTRFMGLSNVEISRLTSISQIQIPKIAKYLADLNLIAVKKGSGNANMYWVDIDKANELLTSAKDNYELIITENSTIKSIAKVKKGEQFKENMAKGRKRAMEEAVIAFSHFKTSAQILVDNLDEMSSEEVDELRKSIKTELGYCDGDIQLLYFSKKYWKENYNEIPYISLADYNTIRGCFVDKTVKDFSFTESDKERLRKAIENYKNYTYRTRYFGTQLRTLLNGDIFNKKLRKEVVEEEEGRLVENNNNAVDLHGLFY